MVCLESRIVYVFSCGHSSINVVTQVSFIIVAEVVKHCCGDTGELRCLFRALIKSFVLILHERSGPRSASYFQNKKVQKYLYTRFMDKIKTVSGLKSANHARIDTE